MKFKLFIWKKNKIKTIKDNYILSQKIVFKNEVYIEKMIIYINQSKYIILSDYNYLNGF
jgi:hypothetical protein